MMRGFLPIVVGASLVSMSIASAQTCPLPTKERAAFDVEGLKSELMVTALTCSARHSYNTFILHFRPVLVSQEQLIDRYFIHRYGSRWHQEHDAYITNLANAQSSVGLRLGTMFCHQTVGTFGSVLALSQPADLVRYALANPVVQPYPFNRCGGKPPVLIATTKPAKKTGAKKSLFGRVFGSLF